MPALTSTPRPAGAIWLDTSRSAKGYLKGQRPTGIDRVCLAYQAHYRTAAHAMVGSGGRHGILGLAGSRRLFDFLDAAADAAPAPASWATRLSRAMALAGIVGPALGSREALRVPTSAAPPLVLNVGHAGLDHPHYARWLLARKTRSVFMVHDLIPITHPEFARPNEAERHGRRLGTMLQSAAGLIVNSLSTLDTLRHYAGRARLRLPPWVVSPLGVGLHTRGAGAAVSKSSAAAHAAIANGVAAPYFVMLGTIEARKNHVFILQLWRRMVEQLGPAAPRLVIIGRRGWEAEGAFDMLDRCETLRGFVFELSSCSDNDLVHWLQHANGLLFPSLVEGYGLPLSEALALGTPVIASDLAVFREAVPSARGVATYLDPLDGIAWLHAIRDQAGRTADELATQRVHIQRAFRAPSWQRHFGIVDDFLNELNGASDLSIPSGGRSG